MKKFEISWHKTQKIWKKTINQTFIVFFCKRKQFQKYLVSEISIVQSNPYSMANTNEKIKFFLGDSVSLCPFLLYQSKSLGNFWTISLPILSTSSIQRKQIFLSILAFSVPASSLCWSSTWSNAFFVKITEVLPTLFSAKTSELTQLFKTFPIRQTTKLKH